MIILHYLRLDSFILVLLFLSILCMYYAVTAKLKSKLGNLLLGFILYNNDFNFLYKDKVTVLFIFIMSNC